MTLRYPDHSFVAVLLATASACTQTPAGHDVPTATAASSMVLVQPVSDNAGATTDRRPPFDQADGNLVLYHNGVGPIWASGTVGTSPGETAMQGDGNLVVYNVAGQPLWASGTAGNPGACLRVQSDGNTVIYSASGSPLWDTGTCCR